MAFVVFTAKEKKFLETHELCRLATVYPDGGPHVVPVNYVFQDDVFYIAAEYESRKVQNIRRNNKVALVVDVYRPNKGVMIRGEAALLERGHEFRRTYEAFYKRFLWVRRDPWSEGEAPFIAIRPVQKVSWGL